MNTTTNIRDNPLEAIAAIKAADPVMAAVIDQVGPFDLGARRPPFMALARAIVFQQLATKAAAAILARVLALYGGEFPTPKQLLATPDIELRRAGLSGRKVEYLKGLASAFLNGLVDEALLDSLTDEEIVLQLTQLRGIDRWSAEMFLLFCLGRPNVLPLGDLGLRQAVGRLYGLGSSPTDDEIRSLAERWQPYCSVATWYMWRSQFTVALTIWTSDPEKGDPSSDGQKMD